MPKGDYQRLKADVEDGIVPVAHLLLEALSMAKLNGVAKGLVLFIWRRTYGWAEEGKRKFKDDRITLAEFATAVNSERTYVSTQLKLLVKSGVVYEKPDPDNGRYKRYGMNTEIDQWSPQVIEVDKLVDAINEKLYVHSSRNVVQKQNGLANTQPFANAQPLCDSTTKPLCKSTTFSAENPSRGAEFQPPKESIKKYKKIDDDAREREPDLFRDYQLPIMVYSRELFPATNGFSQAVSHDVAEILCKSKLPVELAYLATKITAELGKDEGFAKTKIRRWIQSGVRDVDGALEKENAFTRTTGETISFSTNFHAESAPSRASPAAYRPLEEDEEVQAFMRLQAQRREANADGPRD